MKSMGWKRQVSRPNNLKTACQVRLHALQRRLLRHIPYKFTCGAVLCVMRPPPGVWLYTIYNKRRVLDNKNPPFGGLGVMTEPLTTRAERKETVLPVWL